MYSFKNDYAEGAHIQILHKLLETNSCQQQGYGGDEYCLAAKELIRKKIQHPEAAIFFLSGGTQTNLTVISSLLHLHEAVISAKTGHIYANETGAIEANGHRIITVDTEDGKLRPADLEGVLGQHTNRPHVVKPRLVYISNATELGTIYSKAELTALSACCKAYGLLLFMDGARLGHALMARDNDLHLSDIAMLTDVFYIGGTKNGALLGEAVVFGDPAMAASFDYAIKQKGGLLAKGRILGIQFMVLFSEDLYFALAAHANAMAMKLSAACSSAGYTFLTASTTNQIFPILPLRIINMLKEQYDFYIWKEIDAEHAAIRLITSWATEESTVEAFIHDMHKLQP